MGVGLVANDKGLVPCPGVLNEGLVLNLGGVELLEAVRLPVGGDIEGRGEVLTADDESTRDDRGVALTVDAVGMVSNKNSPVYTAVQLTTWIRRCTCGNPQDEQRNHQ